MLNNQIFTLLVSLRSTNVPSDSENVNNIDWPGEISTSQSQPASWCQTAGQPSLRSLYMLHIWVHILTKIPLCQVMHIYFKNNRAKFHSNPIRNDGALGLFKESRPSKKKKNKISSDMGSVPDLRIIEFFDTFDWVMGHLHKVVLQWSNLTMSNARKKSS